MYQRAYLSTYLLAPSRDFYSLFLCEAGAPNAASLNIADTSDPGT